MKFFKKRKHPYFFELLNYISLRLWNINISVKKETINQLKKAIYIISIANCMNIIDVGSDI
jgi:hypothetical protein